jgi:hypothetical protein
MNLDSVLIMLGINVFTRLTLCLLSQRRKESLIRRRRERAGYICAIVMPKKSGKTRLISKLQGSGGKIPTLLVDLGDVLKEELGGASSNEQNRKVVYYPRAKEYLEKLKGDFHNHRIIVYSDDYELINYLEIADVVVYAPRLSVHSAYVSQISDPEKRREIELSYVRIIASDTRPIVFYETLDSVSEQMRQRYGLTLTI